MKKINHFVGSVLMLSTFLALTGCQQNTPATTSQSPTNTTKQSTMTAPVESTPAATPATPTPSSAAVSIQNMAFDKKSVTVGVGATVTWTNRDSFPHTVTSDTAMFNSGNVGNGQSFAFTFSKEGTYTYHCAVHPSMTGTVVVKS